MKKGYEKGKIEDTPAFYNKLVQKSGKSSSNLTEVFKRWYLAYKDNLNYQNYISEINKKFRG